MKTNDLNLYWIKSVLGTDPKVAELWKVSRMYLKTSLASGAVKIPAKTKSGYCLKAPQEYVATGDENYPVITGAMPRCEDVKDTKVVIWQPLH